MKFIVCLKQVPETESVKMDEKTGTLMRTGIKGITNPYDLYALEAALRLKEVYHGEIIAISMGPPQAEESLREAISYGADEAILLSDRLFAGADTLATSYTLAQVIKKIGNFDLVLCGKEAIDGNTAQVGPQLAQRLSLPYAAYVREIRIEEGKIIVERALEDGCQTLALPLPALVTVVKEIGEPRLPSIRGKMQAKKAHIPIWVAKDISAIPEKIGLTGSATRVIKIFSPPLREKRGIISGTVEEQAKKLLSHLQTQGILKSGNRDGY